MRTVKSPECTSSRAHTHASTRTRKPTCDVQVRWWTHTRQTCAHIFAPIADATKPDCRRCLGVLVACTHACMLGRSPWSADAFGRVIAKGHLTSGACMVATLLMTYGHRVTSDASMSTWSPHAEYTSARRLMTSDASAWGVKNLPAAMLQSSHAAVECKCAGRECPQYVQPSSFNARPNHLGVGNAYERL